MKEWLPSPHFNDSRVAVYPVTIKTGKDLLLYNGNNAFLWKRLGYETGIQNTHKTPGSSKHRRVPDDKYFFSRDHLKCAMQYSHFQGGGYTVVLKRNSVKWELDYLNMDYIE